MARLDEFSSLFQLAMNARRDTQLQGEPVTDLTMDIEEKRRTIEERKVSQGSLQPRNTYIDGCLFGPRSCLVAASEHSRLPFCVFVGSFLCLPFPTFGVGVGVGVVALWLGV